jgi:hypothetical protein
VDTRAPVAPAQPLPDDLGHGVERERDEEQEHRGEEEDAVQRAAVGRLGISTAVLADSVRIR